MSSAPSCSPYLNVPRHIPSGWPVACVIPPRSHIRLAVQPNTGRWLFEHIISDLLPFALCGHCVLVSFMNHLRRICYHLERADDFMGYAAFLSSMMGRYKSGGSGQRSMGGFLAASIVRRIIHLLSVQPMVHRALRDFVCHAQCGGVLRH